MTKQARKEWLSRTIPKMVKSVEDRSDYHISFLELPMFSEQVWHLDQSTVIRRLNRIYKYSQTAGQ